MYSRTKSPLGRCPAIQNPKSKIQNRDGPFPFSAVVGLEAAKHALLLLAIDPGLKGVLVGGPSGTAKSVLIRSMESILPCCPEAPASPFIELPCNATDDRVLGGLDLETTLASGRSKASVGLLAQAHGGVLLVDDVNLLDESVAAHIAAALESGLSRVEREGVSEAYPSEFSLVGAYNSQEGEVSGLLLDRVGILVDFEPVLDSDARTEIVERRRSFQGDQVEFVRDFAAQTLSLAGLIEEARERLYRIPLSTDAIRTLTRAAVSLGVEGNRADLFSARAARASAALRGRDVVTEEDIITAIALVLVPRATKIPSEPQSQQSAASEPDRPDSESTGESQDSADAVVRDLIIQAIDAGLPDQPLSIMRSARRRSAAGKRAPGESFTSGRYVRSVQRRLAHGRVAIDATVRAAAPHQVSRRSEGNKRARLKITADDLRFKKHKRRSGVLFIFVVDASGSMALNRMAQAKGALARLLQSAYLHRDRVALIGFRGEGASVLLPPTRSVELGKRAVDAMPVGGATPLAAGLVKAIELAGSARLQERAEVLLVVFTDGRSNVSLRSRNGGEHTPRREVIINELRDIGAVLHLEGIGSVVVDTRSRFVSAGEGRELAQFLNGRYLYLPRADEQSIYEAVSAAAETARSPADR